MSGRAGARGARAYAGGLFTASRWPCVWLCSVGRARGRWRARAGRFSAGSRTRARGRPGVGGVPSPPRCPPVGLAASSVASGLRPRARPGPPATSRPCAEGRPGPAGAASGWRVEPNLGTGGPPRARATLLKGRQVSSVPSGWAPISLRAGIREL